MHLRPTTLHLPPALGAHCREVDEPPQDRVLSLEAGVPDPHPIRSSEQLGLVVELEVRPPEGAEEEPLRSTPAPLDPPPPPRIHFTLPRPATMVARPSWRPAE
jgi:hypothetical protein